MQYLPELPYTLDAQYRLPWLDVSVRTYSWVESGEQDQCEPGPIVYMLLTPWQAAAPARYRIDRRAEAFSDLGAVFLAPPDLPLRFRSSACGTGLRTIRCRFDRARFEEIGELPRRWHDDVLGRCFDIRSVAVSESLMRLARETQCPGQGSPFMIEALGTQIAVELARWFGTDGPLADGAAGVLTARQMRLVTGRVEDLSRGMPTVAELADLCDVSNRHLLRLYRRTTGHTIGEYVEEMRLRKAKALLSGSDLPLKVIAHRLAYSGPSSFSVAFRRATGTTPLTYRRQFSS